MNILEIFGHLGADPETRVTPSGQKVTTLRIASNIRKGGKDETMWWRVTLWGTEFDNLLPHLKKGSALIVVGNMDKPEIYTDKEGRQQISLQMTAEFIRFSPFGKSERSEQQQQQQQQQRPAMQHSSQPFQGTEVAQYASGYASGGHAESEDDQMPF